MSNTKGTTRRRRHFARVRATVSTPNGLVQYTIKQTRQGLTIRRLHGRHPAYLHWPELIAMAEAQQVAAQAPKPEPHPELFPMEPQTEAI